MAFSVAGGNSTTQAEPLKIAAQTWSTRAFGSPEVQIDLIKSAGIGHVETFGSLGEDAQAVRAMLDASGIKAISTHVGLDDLRDEATRNSAIARQRVLGNSTIVMPWIPPEQRPTDADGWAALGVELNGIAETLKGEGFRLAYHNHDFDLVSYDGRTRLEILLDAAEGAVEVELDVGWVAAAGLDPVELLEKLSGQVILIHAKDLARSDNPGPTAGGQDVFGFNFAAVGDGIIDWDSLVPAAREAGAEWFIIEHDFPPDAAMVLSRGQKLLSGYT